MGSCNGIKHISIGSNYSCTYLIILPKEKSPIGKDQVILLAKTVNIRAIPKIGKKIKIPVYPTINNWHYYRPQLLLVMFLNLSDSVHRGEHAW